MLGSMFTEHMIVTDVIRTVLTRALEDGSIFPRDHAEESAAITLELRGILCPTEQYRTRKLTTSGEADARRILAP
jgi:hypothetical protein